MRGVVITFIKGNKMARGISRSKFIAEFLHKRGICAPSRSIDDLQKVIENALQLYSREHAIHWLVLTGYADKTGNTRESARKEMRRIRKVDPKGDRGFVYIGQCFQRGGRKKELVLEI